MHLEEGLNPDWNQLKLTCLTDNCTLVIPDTVWRLVLSKEMIDVYENLLRDSLMQTSPLVIKCPSDKCGNYLKLESKGVAWVKICPCGF